MQNQINPYMLRALELAQCAAELGEVPVGAVVVRRTTGEIIGEGYNRRETDRDPLAHAEILAIREASQTLKGWRLSGCDLYVTLEPCPMCSGAILNARISTVYFGAYDKKAGSVYSVQEMFELPYNHRPEVFGGIMQEACGQVLSDFFERLRENRRDKN